MSTSAEPASDRPDPAASRAAADAGSPDASGGSSAGGAPGSDAGHRSPIKVERVLAELNRLRSDLEKDPRDPEWFAIHHAFCFVSYKMGDFQRYLDETVKPGEHPDA